jgi:uncharacterized protein YbaR (Trm112 family)
MNNKLLPLLVCPCCHGRLVYERSRRELICDRDRLAFPVRNGVPVLLEMDARRLDSGADAGDSVQESWSRQGKDNADITLEN